MPRSSNAIFTTDRKGGVQGLRQKRTKRMGNDYILGFCWILWFLPFSQLMFHGSFFLNFERLNQKSFAQKTYALSPC
jgi:hypothetical protein